MGSIFVLTLVSLAQICDCSNSNSNLNLNNNLNLNVVEKNLVNEKINMAHLSKITTQNQINRAKSVNQLLNKKKKKAKKNYNNTYPKMMFLWEGWLRFIRLTDNPAPMRPSNFYVNPTYHYQKVYKHHIKKKDSSGFKNYKNIKDKFEFFGVLKTEGLYIFKSRRITLDRAVMEIKIVDIKKINEKKKFLSSVREIGKFHEGACMRIKTKIPMSPNKNFEEKSKGHTEDYIICFDKAKQRDKLVKLFVDLKFAQQKHLAKMKKLKKPKGLKMKPAPNILKPKGWLLKDGYWIKLQDWTSCSLKCGGGTSWQQWMCVPPKKGGKKCQGKAIRTKPCNTQPCPGTIGIKNPYSKSGMNKTLKPIIRSAPFSKTTKLSKMSN